MGAPPAPWRRRDVDAAQEDVALAHHLQDCLSWRGVVSATQAGHRGRADALPTPLPVLGRERPVVVLPDRALCLPTFSVCCFVLLAMTDVNHLIVNTARLGGIGTGISEPSKRVPIFVGLF